MSSSPWKIHKFGGSSLADADCFSRVAALLLDSADDRLAVVVSAMAGMTDALLALTVLAEQDNDCDAQLGLIGARYSETAKQLVDGEQLINVLDAWSRDVNDIRDALKAVTLAKSATQRCRDIVAGYGEIWSARLLAALLKHRSGERGGTWVDARQVITVRQSELGPTVLWEASQANFARVVLQDFTGIAVVTGFIASDEDGLQTTLGRNGSDYSAAIFAALSEAAELTIWSDVDGVMSADPKRVPEAQVIEQLTYKSQLAVGGVR